MNQHLDRLAAAQAAIRAGNKRLARELLQQEVQDDPQNFRAWLWLAGLAPSPQASLEYVQRAEQLNPGDPGVKKARAWAEQRLAQQQTPAQVAPAAEQETPPEEPPPEEAPREPVSGHQPPAAAPRGQEQAAMTEASAAPRIGALSEEGHAGADKTPPQRRRPLAMIAAVLLLGIVVAAGLLWPSISDRWSGGLPGLDAPGSVAESVAETVTPTPTAAADQPESDLSAVSFVSGHFTSKLATDPQPTADLATSPATATPQPLTIQPKPLNQNDNNPRPTWTITPSPTLTPTTTPTPAPTFVSDDAVVGGAVRPAGVGPNERWIDVNLSTQTLVAYEGDDAVFNSLVSSGTWLHPTVTGQFRVWLRYTAQTMDGRRLGYDYYLPNVPYVMYFYRDYALHGTYWHNNFGTPMSHGCVNLPTPAAEWIFNWSSIGTLVNVHH